MAKARRTAKQKAASKRNLEKARAAKKRGSESMKALDSEVNLNMAVRGRPVANLVPKRQGPWSLYPRPLEQRRQKALKALKLGNGSKTGVMTSPQHSPSGGSSTSGKIYTAVNSSGQTIRKRSRMDAEAIRRGFYEW